MRFVVYGAGAVGGVIGGRLHAAGYDVTLIARGDHGKALTAEGLRLVSPDDEQTLAVPTLGHPEQAGLEDGDVVLLAMKSQHTPAAVAALQACAPPGIRVVCAQNGVENERVVLRAFPHVYSMVVMLPATHLHPGVVIAHSAPCSGILDLGRYPGGVDDAAKGIAEALSSSTFESVPRVDILSWKYRKLSMNLANAATALCGPGADIEPIMEMARAEGETAMAAAGIDVVSWDTDRDRRGDLMSIRPAGGVDRPGGSSWQSLMRSTGSIECAYFNGEVVLLGRLHGVPTPANAVLSRMADAAAAAGQPPGSVTVEEVMDRIKAESSELAIGSWSQEVQL